ncbi:c-type cytochrome [Candidatus Nitrospira salsa]
MKTAMILFIGFLLVMCVFPANTIAEERDFNKGKKLYLKYCEKCHGQEGKGDGYTLFNPPVADLTSPEIQKKTDAELWHGVHEGIPNTAMGTWRFVLSDEEINSVLAFLRSFGH